MLAERRALLVQQREDIDAVLAEIDVLERDCRRRLKHARGREAGAVPAADGVRGTRSVLTFT